MRAQDTIGSTGASVDSGWHARTLFPGVRSFYSGTRANDTIFHKSHQYQTVMDLAQQLFGDTQEHADD
jgi:hypothetical protein